MAHDEDLAAGGIVRGALVLWGTQHPERGSTFGSERQRLLYGGLHGFKWQAEHLGHRVWWGDVVYPDRADEDKKRLVYTSAPLETDLEITGSPVLTVEMSSTTSDGAFHAYLEDVSSEGRVTYVDEGILRALDRKEVDPKSLPYEPLGPAHSFLRKDAEPLTPGEAARIRFALYPTSVLLRKGHRIRVALAGADASAFQRYPAEGTPTWTVYREAQRASSIELPVRGNRESSQ
ncbi:MAG: CocE/NonD family hydrolase [Candidatus Sulfotelmatobacter sp.]